MFAGRKKESEVWKWFQHDNVSDRSTCLAKTADGKSCELKLAGKNPTNLKVSLAVIHFRGLFK